MALHGDLKDFTLSQLFNIISLAKKNGALILKCDTEVFVLYFKEGIVISSGLVGEDNSLASILLVSNHINNKQFSILREKASYLSDKELGIILVNAGYVRQEEIIKYYQKYCLSIIKRLYSKNAGRFYFDPNKTISNGKIHVQIKMDNLIVESSRYVRGVEYLRDEIPNLDMSLRIAKESRNKIKNVNLSPDEWRVISFIQPQNTIKDIATFANLNDREIRSIVYSLIQAGIVEVKRPLQANYSMRGQTFIGIENRIEQKKIVTKLIDRIRAL